LERATVVEVYDDGTGGANEVARMRLEDGREVVDKVMLSNKIYHQRRKALTEVTAYLLDRGLGGAAIVPPMYAELFTPTPGYLALWGAENAEGAERVCRVVRQYAPAQPGDEWRGEVYRCIGNLAAADMQCRSILSAHPDAERISLLDFLTINQDRSARNWVTDHGHRFYAIDNGMAWFHEYPESDAWQQGCVIDDVILQVKEWSFISGIFSTLWAGRPLSPALLEGLWNFDQRNFLDGIDRAAVELGFPAGLSADWRFEGIMRRLDWITDHERQPTAEEYRAWHMGSPLMTPPEITETGGKIVWKLEMDRDLERV
jgi:hypothetical protein